MLRPDDFCKSQLVLTGWRFGKEYGGHLAACMVMGTLANRVRLGWGSWLEVLERIPVLSAEENIPFQNEYPRIWEPNFVRLLHEVDGIFDNSTKDLSCGAVYWGDLRRIEREWFKDNVLKNPDRFKVADMNTLCFWR